MWKKLVGLALVWVALACLINVPSAAPGARTALVSGLGFLAFAIGGSLILDWIKD